MCNWIWFQRILVNSFHVLLHGNTHTPKNHSPEDLMYVISHSNSSKGNVFPLPANIWESERKNGKVDLLCGCLLWQEEQIPAGTAKLHKYRMQSSFRAWMLAEVFTREDCIVCFLSVFAGWNSHQSEFYPSVERQKWKQGLSECRRCWEEALNRQQQQRRSVYSSFTEQHYFM